MSPICCWGDVFPRTRWLVNQESSVSKKLLKVAIFFCVLIPISGIAQVQDAGVVNYVYSDRIDASTNVAPLGDDLFGDSTNFEDGSTQFSTTDVALRTNVKLPLQLGRVLKVLTTRGWDSYYDYTPDIFGSFWRADLPYIEGDFVSGYGWGSGAASGCSGGNFSVSAINVSSIIIHSSNFFFGNDINIPGYGRERMFGVLSGTPKPTDGNTYVGTTKSNWKVSCLSAIKNGSGEGFIVLLPDGAKYYFDWLASEKTGTIKTDRGWLTTIRMRMYATKAVDRFGGTIQYAYDPANPHRVTQISSSDQRQINVSYDSGGHISSISAGGKVWLYQYSGSTIQTYQAKVILPDGSSWTYGYAPAVMDSTPHAGYPCDFTVGTRTSTQAPGPGETGSIQITHPSGATGLFEFRALMFGYNGMPNGCYTTYGWPGYPPLARIANSLYRKTISGPGITTKTINISYYPSWSYQNQCGSGCPTTASTVVTESSGKTTTYVFGNDFNTNAGRLLSKTVAGQNVSQTETTQYLSSIAGQPFTDDVGEDRYFTVKLPMGNKNRPIVSRTLQRDGRKFIYQVNQFDQFARPTSVTKSSSPSP